MDSYDGNKQLDRQEFLAGLKNLQVDLTESEAFQLMAYLDKDGSGTVNMSEFLVGIRVAFLFCMVDVF